MKNKKSLIAIVALIGIAALGGTFAYFQYTQSFNNEFTTGASTIAFTEDFSSPSSWTPCTQTPKVFTINNTSGFAVNARVKFTQNWDKLDEQTGAIDSSVTLPLQVNNQDMAVIHFANPSDWVLNTTDGYYYYQSDIASGSSTSSFIDYVTFNCAATNDYSSARYHLILNAETVQADAAARASKNWNPQP